MLCRSLIVSVVVLLSAQPAMADSPPLPFRKGLNLSSWLANAPRQPLFEKDFIQIKKAGFDHVRLPFNPEMYGFTPDSMGMAHMDFAPLDRAIAMAERQSLPVIIDMHLSDAYIKMLENDRSAEPPFINLWAAVAMHYKTHPKNALVFELLNEPQYYKNEEQYEALVGKLIAAIRKQDTQHMIVIAAARGSSIEGLQALQPVDDANVAYDFHFYEPYMVTHQGIHMGFTNKMLSHFHDVPYPSDRVDHDATYYAGDAPDPAKAQNELKDYTDNNWNGQHIAARIQLASQWATEHKVRLICGEFGVLRNHIDPASRYRWIEDTRKALEEGGIGWELWDYTDLFGIAQLVGQTSTDKIDGSVRLADPEKGSRIIEPAAIKALGLTPSSSASAAQSGDPSIGTASGQMDPRTLRAEDDGASITWEVQP